MFLDRREFLRIGSLSLFSPWVFSADSDLQASVQALPKERTDRRAIFILLQGGPSHIDLWDPKPNAPEQVRGPFKPISTSLKGLQVGELLANTAKVAHHLAVVRSVEHRFANHIGGTYITLTGSTNQPDADREAKGEDFPGPGAVLNYLQKRIPTVPVSVSLPNWLSIPGPSNRMPGQYGGFIGATYDPFLLAGNPNSLKFQPLTLSLPGDMTTQRLRSRANLRKQMDGAARHLESQLIRNRDRLNETALKLLTNPRFRQALDLNREPDRVRDRYGRTKIGQSLLLARRLIEVGVRFVAYNEFNQGWDHHSNIRNSLGVKVPRMEQAYAALVADLVDRGLLEKTLVVNTGEFGRTPIMNKTAGRDHWPHAYTTVLAGGGIRPGQIYGSTDSRGAYVSSNPVSPADILATMWTCLRIDPDTELRDQLNRPYRLSTGKAIQGLL